ncbi:MAG: ATP-dependent Clp protease proteolytic subunit [Gemmatimonadota bacterium]|nr:ATP-dependent Clp protease proteolytic subunit [Gemmatimonadota bacterium]
MTDERFSDTDLLRPLGRPLPPGEDPDEDEGEPPLTPTASRWTDSLRDRLFRARTLIISGEVNQKLASEVIGQLWAMDAQSQEPITVFINSQGGHVESGDTIHDMLRFIRSPVRMIGTGWVASAGALIYVAVPLENRFSLPNTRFLLHQPAGGTRGTAADVEIEAREILKMRERLNRVFAEQTGQPLERIQDDTHRNFWLGATEAKEYGLVGRIIQHVSDLD